MRDEESVYKLKTVSGADQGSLQVLVARACFSILPVYNQFASGPGVMYKRLLNCARDVHVLVQAREEGYPRCQHKHGLAYYGITFWVAASTELVKPTAHVEQAGRDPGPSAQLGPCFSTCLLPSLSSRHWFFLHPGILSELPQTMKMAGQACCQRHLCHQLASTRPCPSNAIEDEHNSQSYQY